MLHQIRKNLLLFKNSVSALWNEVLFIRSFQNQLRYVSSNSFENENIPSTENIREIPIKLESKDKFEPKGEAPFTKERERTTFSSEEVNKFKALANSWWNREGEFKPLHSLNRLRIELIRNGLVTTGATDPEYRDGPQPLKGVRILDVGCGGGILCEPLARLGAEVTGVDASEESIQAAELHAQKDQKVASNVKYIQGTIEEHARDVPNPYDAVIASEVLEHVKSVDYFLETCISLIRPGGSIFITTINRTTRSWVGAIILAEYVFGLLPRGTHDWNKFIPSEDLRFLLQKYGCVPALRHGMFYFFPKNEWYWISDPAVNYAVHAVKKLQQ